MWFIYFQVKTIPWLIRSFWMVMALNRWHVFRDMPDYAIRQIRGLRTEQGEDERSFGRLADDEWRLRKKQQLRYKP